LEGLYENNAKKYLYFFALAWRDIEVIDKNIESKHLINSVGELFVKNGKSITTAGESGSNTRAKKEYTREKEYNDYIERIETVIKNRMTVYEL
jgi:hypothetical protein